MAAAIGIVIDADSSDDPGVFVQQINEQRGYGLIAAKSFVKGQTILREKVKMKLIQPSTFHRF